MSEIKQDISSPAEFFQSNLYVLLDGVISKDFCDELTKHIFDLYENKKMVKDDQCPKSDAIYGDPVFDGLLEKLAEPLGNHIGKELLPTYSYARIYRPGEVLARHTDRPACEISGTMTLGCDGRHIWPIYVTLDPEDMNGRRIDLKVGDILMYRGEELAHWRPAFKGKWQCQVFFHFVDANGPHSKEAFDGRPELGLSAQTKDAKNNTNEVASGEGTEITQINPDVDKPKKRDGLFPIYGGVMIPSWDLTLPGIASVTKKTHPTLPFNDKECDAIIDLASDAYASPGSVGAGETGAVDKNIRNVNLYLIPLEEKTKWIYDRVARTVSIINDDYFNFEIMGITHELQLLHYESGNNSGHYNWHMDMGGLNSSTRKISVSVQLSDPNTYEGGILTINSNGGNVPCSKERGAIHLFPSYCMHEVASMKSGERWALVIWVHGSGRFR